MPRIPAERATAEMRTLVERFPNNPYLQRLLAYGECRTGQGQAGRARYWRTSEMKEAAAYPALAARPLLMLCWDAMGAKEYAEALRAAEERLRARLRSKVHRSPVCAWPRRDLGQRRAPMNMPLSAS